MTRRALLSLALGAAPLAVVTASAGAPATAPAPPEVHVVKNPSCGCCTAWVAHLRSAGFGVRVTEVADTAAERRKAGPPDAYGSCLTARVGGDVVEGHVPARDIRRLLAMRPVAIGLAVPGMPGRSPGMDTGGPADP